MKTPILIDEDEMQDFVDNCEYLYFQQLDDLRRNPYVSDVYDDDDESVQEAKEHWILANRIEILQAYDAMLNPCEACNNMPAQDGCPRHS